MSELLWQKSSFSSGDVNTNCIEIASGPSVLHLRESDDPGVVINPGRSAIRAFLSHLKDETPAIR